MKKLDFKHKFEVSSNCGAFLLFAEPQEKKTGINKQIRNLNDFLLVFITGVI